MMQNPAPVAAQHRLPFLEGAVAERAEALNAQQASPGAF